MMYCIYLHYNPMILYHLDETTLSHRQQHHACHLKSSMFHERKHILMSTKHTFWCLNHAESICLCKNHSKSTCFMDFHGKNKTMFLRSSQPWKTRQEMKVGQLSCVKCGALPREVFSRIAARAGEQWTQNLVQKDHRFPITRIDIPNWSELPIGWLMKIVIHIVIYIVINRRKFGS